jgi:subtilisin family serine protease
MCDCVEGRIILTHDREDGAGNEVVGAVLDKRVPGVSYTCSMDQVMHAAGFDVPRGKTHLHLLGVEPGLELWSAGDLQFRYQDAFLSAYERGYVQPGSQAYQIFRDPNRHLVAAPDSAVGLTQTFHFDAAMHATYKGLLNASNPAQTGVGVEVAVVDTGLDANAAFAAGGLSRSFHDDTTTTSVDDTNGHGTAVASVISDVAPGAKLRVLKIGDYDRMSEWNLAAAMLYGATADVINLSLGYSFGARDCRTCGRQQSRSSRSAVFERVITDVLAINPEVIVVAAAGNRRLQELDFPARFSNVVAVGAVDSATNVASYSNTGAIDHWGGAHDRLYFAPGGGNGEFVGATIDAAGNGKDREGTSFAAPYVSALLAIYRQPVGGVQPSASATLDHFQRRAVAVNGYSQALHGNGLIRL